MDVSIWIEENKIYLLLFLVSFDFNFSYVYKAVTVQMVLSQTSLVTWRFVRKVTNHPLDIMPIWLFQPCWPGKYGELWRSSHAGQQMTLRWKLTFLNKVVNSEYMCTMVFLFSNMFQPNQTVVWWAMNKKGKWHKLASCINIICTSSILCRLVQEADNNIGIQNSLWSR